MGNTRQAYMRMIFLYGILMTAWVFWAVCGRQAAHAVSRLFRFSMEEEAVYETTATQFRYPEAFRKTLQRYQGFASLYCEEASPAIPGLAWTDLGASACSQMTPQGICIAGDYMLISAYDNGANAAAGKNGGYVPENSVIYILSYMEGMPGEFLTTLVLPDVNHVGGLAFDGERIWVAKSSRKALSVISYDKIQAAAASGQSSVWLEAYDATVPCGVTASFVSFHDQRIWVGTYSSVFQGQSSLTVFSVQEGLTLQQEDTWQIPTCAQGIAFLEQEGRSYMAVSASCGRFFDSTLYLYELKEGDRMEPAFWGSIALPPMSEELVSDGTRTYVLFESGATCYSTRAYRKCLSPVDRICALDSAAMVMADGR